MRFLDWLKELHDDEPNVCIFYYHAQGHDSWNRIVASERMKTLYVRYRVHGHRLRTENHGRQEHNIPQPHTGSPRVLKETLVLHYYDASLLIGQVSLHT